MADSPLPDEFSDLAPYVDEWSLETEKARARKRVSAGITELRRLHAAVAPRIEAMILYLNAFPNDPDALPPAAKRLFNLARMAMEASAPIDLGWESSDIEDVFPMERIEFSSLPRGMAPGAANDRG